MGNSTKTKKRNDFEEIPSDEAEQFVNEVPPAPASKVNTTADDIDSILGPIIIIGLLIGAGYWGWNYFFNKDQWSLWHVNNLGITSRLGDYDSREDCTTALTKARLSGYNLPECGKNCKPLEGTLEIVCKETFEL